MCTFVGKNLCKMKKLILFLGVLPYLLSAQNATMNVIKEKSLANQMTIDRRTEYQSTVTKSNRFAKKLIKEIRAENRVSTYTNTEINLPDSVYMYEGEEKVFYGKAYFTFDENGRLAQLRIFFDYNGDGIFDEEGIDDYVYTQKGDLIEEDVISSIYTHDKWDYYDREVRIYNPSNMDFSIEYYDYYYDEDSWVLDWQEITTEFDDKGRPLVIMETTPRLENFANRNNITYNERGLISSIISYRLEDVDKWELNRKTVFYYNEADQATKEAHYYYWYDTNEISDEKVWLFSYSIDYEYDEKGNENRYCLTEEDGTIELSYYTYYYPSDPTGNDVTFSVQSSIYPNPVSDVLYVTLEGADNATITLVNAVGSVLVQQKTNRSVTSIPVQSIAKGYYFLIVQTSKGIKTHTVIIR